MEGKLEKRYGLPTAICMVVGIVIGSGVFFKAEAVLKATGGNMPMGILAWLIVGLIMVVCSYVFASMAVRYEGAGGLVDFARAAMGERYAYNVGWFMASIYIPSLTSALAWVSARYFCVLLNWDITGGSCMVISCLFLCADYALNALSPRIAGKFQVSTTVIKMIPLALMAVVGFISGMGNGRLTANFATASVTAGGSAGKGLMASVVAVAFAYEGWILATSISGELKEARKNLPKALVGGSLIVVITYILYYIGLHGAVSASRLMASGEAGAKLAFQNLFGRAAGTGIFVLIVISCLGTLNGLTLSNCRGMYVLAARGEGPHPEIFRQVDSATNLPTNSSVMSLAFSALWLVYFYGANLSPVKWFGSFSFDSSELPIITLYAMYIPLFIMFSRRERDLGVFRRIVMPALGVCGCLFMVYAALAAHGAEVAHYLVIFAIFMLIGNLMNHPKKRA